MNSFYILLQVIFIDLILAGDNAIIVGAVVKDLDAATRKKALVFGVGMAAALRIGLSFVASCLIQIPAIKLVGGIMLGWVCYTTFKDLVEPDEQDAASTNKPPASVLKAIFAITIADLSMSVDNVVAVAGAAVGHPYVLVAGLLLSVALMGAAAEVVARLMRRYSWIGWVGLVLISAVAIQLVFSSVAALSPHP